MRNATKVGILVGDYIVTNHKGRNGNGPANLSSQVLVNSALEYGRNVVEESILGTMLLPIVVRVDRATEFALLFSAGQVGLTLQTLETIETGWFHDTVQFGCYPDG